MRLLVFILILSLTVKIVFNVWFGSSDSFLFYVWIAFLFGAMVIHFIHGFRGVNKIKDEKLTGDITGLEKSYKLIPGLNMNGISYIPFSCSSGYYLHSPKTQNLRIEVIKEINVFMDKHPEYRILNIEHVCNDRGWLEEIGVWLIKKDNLPVDKSE
ncbi:hypothetical protein [Acinetobacter baumannii]|uniref:hypothetical protein n=1 Tax=Acinetobacter baumannii TaxID=470 RepID=UPI001863C2E2|nr:hypothetical protein [Acinetobacter baumannii]HCW5913699.1 hypothetical protein [Acinetobacter baumannii]